MLSFWRYVIFRTSPMIFTLWVRVVDFPSAAFGRKILLLFRDAKEKNVMNSWFTSKGVCFTGVYSWCPSDKTALCKLALPFNAGGLGSLPLPFILMVYDVLSKKALWNALCLKNFPNSVLTATLVQRVGWLERFSSCSVNLSCSSDVFCFFGLPLFPSPSLSLSFPSLFLWPCLIHVRIPDWGRAFVHGHTFLHSWSGPMTVVVGLLHGATFLSNLHLVLFVSFIGP